MDCPYSLKTRQAARKLLDPCWTFCLEKEKGSCQTFHVSISYYWTFCLTTWALLVKLKVFLNLSDMFAETNAFQEEQSKS